ncbi:MAG: hypothetical protein AAFQ14_01110 [Cyanobacteria bacterium J06621_12]
MKITPEEISKIIEFRYFKFAYFYLFTHGFFLLWAILEMLWYYDSPGLWLILWRLIWFPIKTAFPSLIIFFPVFWLLTIPKVKLFSITAFSELLKSFIGYKSLSNLLKEVRKYNINTSNFIVTCVTNNLSSYGSAVMEAEQSLRKSKNFIIKSLEAETILRNHPNYNPEQFLTLVDFSETLRIEEQTSQYSDISSQNVQIALSVEHEIEKLINKRI